MYCVFQSRSFLWGEINFHNKPNKDSLFIIFTFDPNILIESLQCTCNKQQVLTSIFFCSSWKDTYFQDLQPNTKKKIAVAFPWAVSLLCGFIPPSSLLLIISLAAIRSPHHWIYHIKPSITLLLPRHSPGV